MKQRISGDMTAGIPMLRRLGLEDADYIFDLCKLTMRSYVEQVWGAWNEAGVRAHLAEKARAGAFYGLHLGDVRVGAVAFERHDSHYQLEDLYVEPASQGQGIGTFVVQQIIDLARKEALPVRLRVLASNPARHLYERLGFKVVQQTPERYFLERREGA